MTDFTIGESDNALYWSKIEEMDNEKLIEEYKSIMKSRGEGGDREYNLQMCLDILETEARNRGIEFPEVPEDDTIFGHIRMIRTPESKGLEGFGFDFFENTLYVKYKSGKGGAYPIRDVSIQTFEELKKSSKKGGFVSDLKKRKSERNSPKSGGDL